MSKFYDIGLLKLKNWIIRVCGKESRPLQYGNSFDVALIAQSLHTIDICKIINYKSTVNDIGL